MKEGENASHCLLFLFCATTVLFPSHLCTVLLERVFLRLGSAETDEQLEAALAKFLAPALLKLASQAEGVRKKVTCCFLYNALHTC